METAVILKLINSGLGIADKLIATKYQREVKDLEEKYNKLREGEEDEEGEIWIDRNELDRVRRDIRMLGDLVATEISRS